MISPSLYQTILHINYLALRIHVSPQTKEILDQLGGYELEHRGKVILKGRGEVDSFWLNGKQEITWGQLPDPPTGDA